MTTPVTVLGANRTLLVAGGVQKILSGLVDGRVKVQVDTYASSATLDIGSTIKFFNLPTGAKIMLIALMATTAQTSLTYSLGNGDTAALFVTAGATGLQTALTPVLAGGAAYVVGSGTLDSYVLLTTAGAAGTTGTITAMCFYTVD